MCEGMFFKQVKNILSGLENWASAYADPEFLASSNGREFQRLIVEGKKEPLEAFTEQYGTRNQILWPLVDVPEWIR